MTDDAPKKAPDLTQRQVFQLLAYDRAVRGYALAALGALAMIFLVMFMNGSDLGGALVAAFGLATLALRWTAMPPFLLLIIAYFHIFPFGIPDLGSENPFQIRETHFQVEDCVLVLAVLVYFRAQYRVFGLVHQIVPPENALRRKGEALTRRPAAHIRPDEVAWMVGGAAALVVLGQLLWWLANALEFVPLDGDAPLQWRDTQSISSLRRAPPPGEFRPGANRFFVMVGALVFGGLALRLVFGYWRLRVMGAAEGAMVLADTSWAESHRERVRVEKWRVWARNKAKTDAEEADRAERVQQAKEERARERREADERERAREAAERRARAAPGGQRRRRRDDD